MKLAAMYKRRPEEPNSHADGDGILDRWLFPHLFG
jgi:hypothetical protein